MKRDKLDQESNVTLDREIQFINECLPDISGPLVERVHILEVWRNLLLERRMRQREGHYDEREATKKGPLPPMPKGWDQV